LGRGLGWVTHRGPFQTLLFCDSVSLRGYAQLCIPVALHFKTASCRGSVTLKPSHAYGKRPKADNSRGFVHQSCHPDHQDGSLAWCRFTSINKLLTIPMHPIHHQLGSSACPHTTTAQDPREMPSLRGEVLAAAGVWWSLLGAGHAGSQQKSQETPGIMEESRCCFANIP